MKSKITYTDLANLKSFMLKNKKLQNAMKILVVLVLALLLFPLSGIVGDKIQEILPEEVVEVLQEEDTTETENTEEVTEDSEAEPNAEEEAEEEEVVEVDYTSLDYRIPAMQAIYDAYEAAYPDTTYYQADELGRTVFVQSILNDGNTLTCYDYFMDEDPKYCEHTADGILGEEFDYVLKTIEPVTEEQKAIIQETMTEETNDDGIFAPITGAVNNAVDTVKEALPTQEEPVVEEVIETPAVVEQPKTVEVPATATEPAQEIVEEVVEVDETVTLATTMSNKLSALGYDITVAPGEGGAGVLVAGVKDGNTLTCWENYCLLNQANIGDFTNTRTPYTVEEFLAL